MRATPPGPSLAGVSLAGAASRRHGSHTRSEDVGGGGGYALNTALTLEAQSREGKATAPSSPTAAAAATGRATDPTILSFNGGPLGTV